MIALQIIAILLMVDVSVAMNGFVGALVEEPNGTLSIYYQYESWILYLTTPQIYPPNVVMIVPLNETDLLIIGSSPNQVTSTGFTIYNTATGTTRSHPFFQVSGYIMDATSAGGNNFWITGDLGNSQSGDLTKLAYCQDGIGCYPAVTTGTLPKAPLDPSGTYFFTCGDLKYVFISSETMQTAYQLSSGQVWDPSIGCTECYYGWGWTCLAKEAYVSMTMASSSNVFPSFCQNIQNITNMPTFDFAIWKMSGGNCTIVKTFSNRIQSLSTDGTHLVYMVSPSSNAPPVVYAWIPGSNFSENLTLMAWSSDCQAIYYNGTFITTFGQSVEWYYSGQTYVTYSSSAIYYDGKILWTMTFNTDNQVILGTWENGFPMSGHIIDLYGPPENLPNSIAAVTSDTSITIFESDRVLMSVDGGNFVSRIQSDAVLVGSGDTLELGPNQTIYRCQDETIHMPPIYSEDIPFTFGRYGKDGFAVALLHYPTFDNPNYVLYHWLPGQSTWTFTDTTCALQNLVIFDRLMVPPMVPLSSSIISLVACLVDSHGHSEMVYPQTNVSVVAATASQSSNDSIIIGGAFMLPSVLSTSIIRVYRNLSVEVLSPSLGNTVTALALFDNTLYFTMDSSNVYQLTLSSSSPVHPIYQLSNVVAFFGPLIPASLQLRVPHHPNYLWIYITAPLAAITLLSCMVFSTYKIVIWRRKMRPIVKYVKIQPSLESGFSEMKQPGRYLARGAFGSVTTVRHPNGGMYAAKRIKLTDRTKDLALREIQILKMLEHDNTIFLRDSIQDENHVTIYTDLFDGAISDLYVKRPFRLDEIFTIASGLAHAIKYIQGLKIAHRDIKPANILVTLSGYDVIASVQLADFGLATFVEEKDHKIAVEYAGTQPFIAPEVQLKDLKNYDAFAADIFSVGVTIWEVCHGSRFRSDHDVSSPVMLTEELAFMKKLVRKCRKVSPDARWTIDDILMYLRESEKEHGSPEPTPKIPPKGKGQHSIQDQL
eukprot:TRINITY_DN15133_c0_g1_i1.p1 TRINITY_DN15133_c0_g1~~TRINITY_DN15133_c0_g1_i1.p1  ORF type:complete len:991 (-),score=203.25 TRINITY_DN15133_c0_g1_i1:23-2995(-)